MERLWAPWRLKYVTKCDEKKDICVFCEHLKEQDREKKILARGEHCFVIMNIFPYNNGHLMVAPYRHVSSLTDLNREEMYEVLECLAEWTEILKSAMFCHGFNIGINLGRIAGAGIADHLHVHIVPRWDGDTNFMPIIGDTKIIPQSLEECYDLLKKTKEKRDGGDQ
ncbi:MAG: HIT domain-containing protein [Candidatus Eremiobacteraeota bacterium]|nr:HIT domain-containing protein [Candidatus Eremiobacteraeota bacterium]